MANYLYNGIEFPALPELDTTTRPYVYIAYSIGSDAYVIAESTSTVTVLEDGHTSGLFYHKLIDGEWAEADGYSLNCIPLWANFDIYYRDNIEDIGGTLYLAASDPIPVGSAPDIEPRSFMAGLRMGQIVRAMRP